MADTKEPSAAEDKPADSNKPMIITHRAVLQELESKSDSTANSDDSDTTPETKPVAKPSAAIKLKPLEESTSAEPAEKESSEPGGEAIKVKTSTVPKPAEPAAKSMADIKKPEAAAETKVETPAAKPESKPEPETAPSSETTDTSNADSITSDEPTTDKPSDPAAVDAEEAKQAEHDAVIQKLADSKQYYLPINALEKRKTKRFIALGFLLSLVLVVFWVDVALDAGLIKISGIKSVTHFFSN